MLATVYTPTPYPKMKKSDLDTQQQEGYATPGWIGFSAENDDSAGVEVVAIAVNKQADALFGSVTLAFYFCKDTKPIIREVKNLEFVLCRNGIWPKILRASDPTTASRATDRISYMADNTVKTFVFADLFKEHLPCHNGEQCPRTKEIHKNFKQITYGVAAAILIVLSVPLIAVWMTRNR